MVQGLVTFSGGRDTSPGLCFEAWGLAVLCGHSSEGLDTACRAEMLFRHVFLWAILGLGVGQNGAAPFYPPPHYLPSTTLHLRKSGMICRLFSGLGCP